MGNRHREVYLIQRSGKLCLLIERCAGRAFARASGSNVAGVKGVRIDACSWEWTAGDMDFERDIRRDASRMESEASDRLSAGNRPVSCKKGRISGKNRSGITRIYAI